MFEGFTSLGSTKDIPVLIQNASAAPIDADSLPVFRVYGPNGLMSSGTGTCTRFESGTITAASNASPIVITSASHGLQTGNVITISSVGGNTAANGRWVVTRINANTFSLDGSVGNGSYTSGGTWTIAGLYTAPISVMGSYGYEVGETYTVIVNAVVSSVPWAETYTFTVT